MSELLQIAFEPELKRFKVKEVKQQILRMIQAAGINREVNLLFCSATQIRELNQNYRGIDKPTDILSFGYRGPEEPLGDLALCLEVAQAQADEFGFTIEEETLRLVAHGLVHLLGQDHQSPEDEAAMLHKEKSLLKAISLEQLYPTSSTKG